MECPRCNGTGILAEKVEKEEPPWIEWPGGSCPVPLDARVDVKWNNGAVTKNACAGSLTASGMTPDLWQRHLSGGHIIAYRAAQQ